MDNPDFKPVGVKIFSKQRKKGEKKGGGLMLGYKKNKNIILEEINTKSSDILAVEGKVRGCKIRIILTYFDSTKLKSGKDFKRNRNIQRQIEKLFSVEPDVSLVCLGDLNGRLTKLEPGIENDANGDMIENWILKYDLNHLNQTEKCEGVYTFNTKNGKSAIDHICTSK